MLLRKRLRAGILLYALLMAAVFALFLQVYTHRVQAMTYLQVAQEEQATASLMAELAKDLADKERGTYTFNTGSANYVHQKDKLTVTVQLTTGKSYQYSFYKPVAKEQDREQKEPTPAVAKSEEQTASDDKDRKTD